jgi:hypothetical protein
MIISPLASMRWSTGACIRRFGLAGLLPLLALGCSNTTSSSTAPTVTSFSPTTDASGTGTLITVTGTNFSSAITTVTICGVTISASASGSAIPSSTELTFDLPAVTTTGPITVSNSAGTGTSGQDFIVIPTISSITSGTVGSNVTITGNGLLGVTSVVFTNTSTDETYTATRDTDTATATKLVITIPSNMSNGTAYELTLKNGYGVDYATTSYTPAS